MNPVATTDSQSLGHSPSLGGTALSAKGQALTKDEQQLITWLRKGDEGAFDELVNKHHSALIRVAMGYVDDREVAEEVVQDTWMAVIENLSRFEGRSSLRTWIFGILIHKAKDRGIREKRHTTFSAFESCEDDNEEILDPSRFQQTGERAGHWAIPPQPWDDQTPEKLLASQETVNAMNNAIDALPRTLKEVLILRDVEGADVKEVCALLNITE